MTEIDHTEDVVYGYKDGMCLAMDVYAPRARRVDAGVIFAISGGWSTDLSRRRDLLQDPEDWGVLPQCLLDAERFHIDPGRLGIVGGSSGGHVSLMTALAPPAPDLDAADPVDRESSEVQAAVAYFPPTDLLNYGATGVTMLESHGSIRAAPLDFRRFDDVSGRFERITDVADLQECYRKNSPITHVRADNPPVLLIHGDSDDLVPLSQSEILRDRLQAAGVANRLVVLAGHGHAWPPMGHGQQEVVDWFGRYLSPDRRISSR